MQRVPGISVQAEVVTGEDPDGAAHLTLHASRNPFAAAVTVNDGSRDDPQALFTVSSNAQTRLAEQLTASFLLPPGDDQAHYQRLGYSQYLDAQGSQLLLSAARYRSDPGTPVRPSDGTDLTQRIKSERYALGFAQPLIVAADEWLEVTGQFYSVSEHIDERGGPRGYDTYVRALSFEGDWRKVEPGRLRAISAGVYQGLDYLGARSDAHYDLDFLRFRLAGVQGDRLLENWQGVASGALFWSDYRLPECERAVFGGQYFGRGYPRDQAAGDKAGAWPTSSTTASRQGWTGCRRCSPMRCSTPPRLVQRRAVRGCQHELVGLGRTAVGRTPGQLGAGGGQTLGRQGAGQHEPSAACDVEPYLSAAMSQPVSVRDEPLVHRR